MIQVVLWLLEEIRRGNGRAMCHVTDLERADIGVTEAVLLVGQSIAITAVDIIIVVAEILDLDLDLLLEDAILIEDIENYYVLLS